MGNCRLIQQILFITYFGAFFENDKILHRYLGRDDFLQFFACFSWHIFIIVYLYLTYFYLSIYADVSLPDKPFRGKFISPNDDRLTTFSSNLDANFIVPDYNVSCFRSPTLQGKGSAKLLLQH